MLEKIQKNPERITPSESMSLQTYEYFSGGEQRPSSVAAFASGEVVRLTLDHPDLPSPDIEQHQRNLYNLISDELPDTATPEYRLAEAYFLRASQDLNDDLRKPSQVTVDHFQRMNESIYGKPEHETVQQMLGRLWSLLDAKRGTAADEVLLQLEEGFTFISKAGEQVDIPALPKPMGEAYSELPTLSEEALLWLQGALSEEMAPAKEQFEAYMASKAARGEDANIIEPKDMVAMFRSGIEALGYQGVDVVVDENATALSWSSAKQAVVIGGKRKPQNNIDELLGVFLHEVGVHGRRHIYGKQVGDESLASGLFTEADDSESPDYLTFEEGLASTLQKAVQGEKETWGIASTALYMNIALAHEGWSPRQIQEVMSRVRLALSIKADTEEITEDMTQKAQKAAANSVVRVFRGTPADKGYKTTDGVTLHYAKDLAYAAGKSTVIPLLNDIAKLPEQDRQAEFTKLFYGKYDPTNHRHKAYVETVVRGRI